VGYRPGLAGGSGALLHATLNHCRIDWVTGSIAPKFAGHSKKV
jgi:hypothetical protein